MIAKFTKELIISMVHEYVDRHNKIPTNDSFCKSMKISERTVRRHFDKWNDLLKVCGYNIVRQAPQPQQTRICKTCKKSFKVKASSKQKNCSIKCGGISKRKYDISQFNKCCKNCKKNFTVTGRTIRQIYCSQKCQQDYSYKLKKEKIKISKNCDDIFLTNTTRKRYIIDERGHKCEICKIIKWMEQDAPLVLDHIDGNSDNNMLDNLRLVCGNCDMQLPTYKSKNRGNGRHSRRKRYAEGKSY